MIDFFADTYAIIEILKGNKNYAYYSELKLGTTKCNLLELAYALVRDHGKSKALEVLSYVKTQLKIVDFTDEDMVNAAEFRLRMRRKGRKPSMVDCLGYVIAKRLNVKFLTGDNEFEGLKNVEFVK
ncbi:MAG: PIN domain-containing protein [Deltaproteobacteria bacterium]|nr:PIN domain-containing protein [Deltaproteobacteria bacterium]